MPKDMDKIATNTNLQQSCRQQLEFLKAVLAVQICLLQILLIFMKLML